MHACLGFREWYRPTLGSEAAGDTVLWPVFLLSCLNCDSFSCFEETENPIVFFGTNSKQGALTQHLLHTVMEMGSWTIYILFVHLGVYSSLDSRESLYQATV